MVFRQRLLLAKIVPDVFELFDKYQIYSWR